MLTAYLADIHANREAFEAVLRHARAAGAMRYVLLGDIVGYGPNPCECAKLVRDRCSVVILGNHDQGALFDPDGFNSGAERAIRWTRSQIEMHDRLPRNAANLVSDFLGELSRNHLDGELMFVHGSARRPLDEYVFPEDIYNPLKMEHIFELVPRYVFQGHTHIPGMFTTSPEFIAPGVPAGETEVAIDLPAGKAMINVGSVGQPRDEDPRSCYVILEDDRRVRFRRITYPFEATRRKIHSIPDLDNFLGDRLALGR